MTFDRIITGLKGLGITFFGGLVGRWIAGFFLGSADISQNTYNAAGGLMTAMVLVAAAVHMIWTVLRALKLDVAINPGLVPTWYAETMAAAAALMAALYLFVAFARIGNFEEITAVTLGTLAAAAFSLVSLYGGLRVGTSDL